MQELDHSFGHRFVGGMGLGVIHKFILYFEF